jgi:hypothetical protein
VNASLLTAHRERVPTRGMKKPRTRRRIIAALIILSGWPLYQFFFLPLYNRTTIDWLGIGGPPKPLPPHPGPCSVVIADQNDPERIGTCTGDCPDRRPPICSSYPKTALTPGARVDGFCVCHDPQIDALLDRLRTKLDGGDNHHASPPDGGPSP